MIDMDKTTAQNFHAKRVHSNLVEAGRTRLTLPQAIRNNREVIDSRPLKKKRPPRGVHAPYFGLRGNVLSKEEFRNVEVVHEQGFPFAPLYAFVWFIKIKFAHLRRHDKLDSLTPELVHRYLEAECSISQSDPRYASTVLTHINAQVPPANLPREQEYTWFREHHVGQAELPLAFVHLKRFAGLKKIQARFAEDTLQDLFEEDDAKQFLPALELGWFTCDGSPVDLSEPAEAYVDKILTFHVRGLGGADNFEGAPSRRLKPVRATVIETKHEPKWDDFLKDLFEVYHHDMDGVRLIIGSRSVLLQAGFIVHELVDFMTGYFVAPHNITMSPGLEAHMVAEIGDWIRVGFLGLGGTKKKTKVVVVTAPQKKKKKPQKKMTQVIQTMRRMSVGPKARPMRYLGGDNLTSYKMALADPFAAKSYGAMVPDGCNLPLIPYHKLTTTTLYSGASGSGTVCFFPSPCFTMVDCQYAQNGASSSIVGSSGMVAFTANPWLYECSMAGLINAGQSGRFVAGGLKLRSISTPYNTQGRLMIAPIIVTKKRFGYTAAVTNSMGGTTSTNYPGAVNYGSIVELLGGWSLATLNSSNVEQMPGAQVFNLSEIIDKEMMLSFRPSGPQAFEFTTLIAGGSSNGYGYNGATFYNMGNNSLYSSGSGSSTLGDEEWGSWDTGFIGWAVRFSGAVANTSILDVDVVHHYEVSPNSVAAGGADSISPSIVARTQSRSISWTDVNNAISQIPWTQLVDATSSVLRRTGNTRRLLANF